MTKVLVTGFGPFPGVPHNPTSVLARSMHGEERHGVRFVGDVLPVSYRRSPRQTLALVDAHKADYVLGTGISRGSSSPRVESVAHHVVESAVDVEGQTATLLRGPALRRAPWAPAVAEALGLPLSDDAGRYVCNAWLYAMLGASIAPRVAFLHVPEAGFDAGRLCDGLARVLRG